MPFVSNFHCLLRDFLTEMRPVFSKMSLTRYCFCVEFTDCYEIDAVYCSDLFDTVFNGLEHGFQAFGYYVVIVVLCFILLNESSNVLQQYHGK